MNDERSGPPAVVIGGGIVGACCARALQSAGFATTLIDRAQPGRACSFGNSGRIATSLAKPKSVPGLIWQVPAMLSNPTHPLKTSIGHVLRELPWFARFFAAGTREQARAITAHLNAILRRTDDAYDRLVEAVGAHELIRQQGTMYVFQDPRLADAERDTMETLRGLGIEVEYLYGNEAREVEPGLPASVTCAYYKPQERHVVDPYALTRAVVNAFAREGGLVVRDEVTEIERGSGGTRIRTHGPSFTAERTVIAAGAWSRRLARQLGITLPVIAERGYHAMLPNEQQRVRTPLHYADSLVAMTPMNAGLRVTSGAEFLDVDAPAVWSRRDTVIDNTRRLFPDVDTERATRWMGSRPSTPDSMPIIGAHPKAPDVVFATGHGTLGLTLAPITAEAVEAIVTDREDDLEFDPAPYRPTRF